MGDPILEVTLPIKHEDSIRQQAAEKDLDPALIAAVIYSESRFRDQTSRAGAKGLMQIVPDTAQFIANHSGGTAFELRDLATPDINIRYGSWYLRYLMQRYDGNKTAAIAAYNAGHGNVDKWGGGSIDLDDIRFPETEAYTRQVLEKRDEYASRRAAELGL
ncbi:MAG: lytic transglycosylase domain-containing protein [Solirubrobacterales bacterium]